MNVLKSSFFLFGMILILVSCGGDENKNKITTLPDANDSTNTTVPTSEPISNVSNTELSEALGVVIGMDLITRGNFKAEEINIEGFNTELKAVLSGEKTNYTTETATAVIRPVMEQKAVAAKNGTTVAAVDPKISGVLGFLVGTNLKIQWGDRIEHQALIAGFKSSLGEGQASIDSATALKIVQQETALQQQKVADKVKNEGAKFLAENGQKEGVKTLPSGIQYKILKEGKGAIPTATDKVKTHYHGTLIDGKVFDSSVNRGKPIEFQLTGVIKGWQEILQLMPTGSKWEVYIPYNLAYGDRGTPQIPPYSTLIFQIELLDIVK